jgi:hypothetical protein
LWRRPSYRMGDRSDMRSPTMVSEGWEVDSDFGGSLTLWDEEVLTLHPTCHPIDLDGSWVSDGQDVTLWAPECHPVSFDADWERDGLAVTLWG